MRAHPAGPRHGELVHDSVLGAPPDDLGRLDRVVWAEGVDRDPDSGVVRIRGVDVRDLVRDYGTPTFVLDETDVRERMREWRAAFGETADVYYAGKAFLCAELVRWADEEGLGLDVCTGGELAVALRAGFPPARIALHGNNKSLHEIDRALGVGVGRIVVDSFEELARVAFLADEKGIRASILIRVTVGVEAHTHEFIATAHEDQKFGFSLASGAAAEAVRRAVKLPALDLVGLHSHIGSQIFDTAGFEVSAHRAVGLAADVRDEHGIELAELDLGGGLGISYVTGDDPLPPAVVADRLREIVGRECAAAGLAVPRLSVEPGRAIVGRSTLTVYEVGTVKPLELDTAGRRRTYVSVDGGMSDNIRTALYDADHTCTLASRSSSAPPMLARVVGKHCESGDVVVKDAWLPEDLAPGDLLAVAATGAYCRSMASTYNHVPRPPVVSVGADGATKVLLRRETEDDLHALDPG
jgi:diaminopimelate decarboxylase